MIRQRVLLLKKATKNSLFERPEGGERAILVHLNLQGTFDQEDLEEFCDLARAAGAQPVATLTGARQTPEPKYFVGSGKANEIKLSVEAHHAEIVLVNHNLSPSQERNLETLLKCRVLDRTGLILDIFAQRARTFEGKLQVELAQLQHLATRLVRGWTHLERQKGGIGLRGPGETQLETDRRLIRQRIKYITQRLDKVRAQRDQSRRARHKAEMPTVAIVGYTNSGKSTLFNTLTSSSVYAADQLFATLDPTLRSILLPNIGKVILADTVGFIRHLPHSLVNAFHATLEETRNADLLLHVIDSHHPQRQDFVRDVNTVLKEIGADAIPQLLVYNKIDLLDDKQPYIERDDQGARAIWLSALTGEGIKNLLTVLTERLGKDLITCTLTLMPEQAKLRAQLYKANAVVQESENSDGSWIMTIRLPKHDYQRLMPMFTSLVEEPSDGVDKE